MLVVIIGCVILLGIIVAIKIRHLLKMRKVPNKLQDDAWETRLDAVKTLNKEIITLIKHQQIQDKSTLLTGEHQPQEFLNEQRARKTALTETITLLLKTSTDPDWHVRREAMTALGHTHDIRAFTPLLNALRDEQWKVRKQAKKALKEVCPVVHTLVFGRKGLQVSDHTHTLCDPDLSDLTLPLPQLQEISILVTTCDLSRLQALIRYMGLFLHEQHLTHQITVSLYGNIGRFPLSLYNAFIHCQHLDVYIERMIFGHHTPRDHDPLRTLKNPDLSEFMLPLSHIKQVYIDTTTYDFYQVERFLTYAVNHIGQKHLQNHVDVYLYGNPEKLHPNLYNNLTNLCKHIYVEEEDIQPSIEKKMS